MYPPERWWGGGGGVHMVILPPGPHYPTIINYWYDLKMKSRFKDFKRLGQPFPPFKNGAKIMLIGLNRMAIENYLMPKCFSILCSALVKEVSLYFVYYLKTLSPSE